MSPDQLKTVVELYDMEIRQKISTPNCQKLKLRLRYFDARNEVVTSRRGLSGIVRKKEFAMSGKQKGAVFERRPMHFPARRS